MVRVLAAAVVGGIVMFAWGFAGHMLLPLGETGFRKLPDEDALVAHLEKKIVEPGVYMFPGFERGREPTPEEWEEVGRKAAEGPTGFFVYQPTGAPPMGRSLAIEFVNNVAAVLLAAMVVGLVRRGYAVRVLIVLLIGLVGWFNINVPYWNWYRFPTDFTVAALVDESAGWLAVGLVIAAIVKPGLPAPAEPE